jgi:apolipoprotein N-acyltransferase
VRPKAPSRPWTLVLAAAGGALTWASFPDIGWWPAAYAGMAALYLALRRDSARWNALVGLVFGLALFGPLITWIDGVVGPVPWVALTVAEALYVAAFGAAWTWARRGEAVWRNAGLQIVVFVVLWVAVEELRAVWPFGGFPWGRLAFSQADAPMAALMAFGGTPLLSAGVAAAGVALARALLALRRGSLRPGIGWLAGAVAVGLVGLVLPLPTSAQGGTLAVGVVQGNVPDAGLDAFEHRRQVLDNHAAGTHALLDQVAPGELDVVLWPENATDLDPEVSTEAAAIIDDAARAVDAPILLGTVQYPNDGGRYNTSILWEPEQGPVARYTKQRPAAFAEYIPIRSFVRLFSPAVDLVTTDMVAGTEPGLIPLDSARLGRTVGLGDVICFEVAYDAIVREAVTAGGEVLVVQTNNANFGRSAESTQQLAMTRLRAIEHGRAAVQVSTVGVSAVVAPNGAVLERTALFEPAQLVASLPLRESTTWATRLGPWPAWIVDALAVCMVVAGAAGAARTRRADRSTSPS